MVFLVVCGHTMVFARVLVSSEGGGNGVQKGLIIGVFGD